MILFHIKYNHNLRYVPLQNVHKLPVSVLILLLIFEGIGTGIVHPWYRKKVSVPVSKIFGTGKRYRYRKYLVPEKSIGIGIGKNWYRKKVSVSKIFGTAKKFRYRYRLKFWVPSHTATYQSSI